MSKPNILQQARAIAPKIIALRRDLHRNPELGRAEYLTAERIERELHALGIETQRIADTGIVGLLRGGSPGRTIAFRADMDALPIQEKADVAWRSQRDGIMHACGHDMHMAALIGAAKLLCAHRESLHGNVKLFFQPDEEGSGGAARMIDAGCMREPTVDAVFAAHVAPELPTGAIGLRSGAAYAASNPFEIIVHGQSAHGATPQSGRDAIVVGSAIVAALQTMISREIAPTDAAVISIGSFQAGDADNIIAERARLGGILRCYGARMRAKLTQRLREIATGIATTMGAQAEVHIWESYSGVINDAESIRCVRAAAAKLFGEAHLVDEPLPTLMTEDFGAFIEASTGCLFHFGVGGKSAEVAPLHSSAFCPDEAALAGLSALEAQIALDYLA